MCNFHYIVAIIFFQQIFLSISLLAQPLPTGAATFDDAAVLWRGFSHQWTYNHRLNRLGNYIDNSDYNGLPYKAQLVHTAATGVGGDVGYFDSQFTYLGIRGLSVESGTYTIDFMGKEGEMHNFAQKITIEAKKSYAGDKVRCVVLLNGFDIVSEEKADKLELFSLDVSNAEYLSASEKIQFDLGATLLVTCKSLECSRFKNKFNYKIKVNFLALIGPADTFNAVEQHSRKVYNWDKKAELNTQPLAKAVQGRSGGFFGKAALGFQSIAVDLDRAHWMLEWHSLIQPKNYDPQTGIFQYGLDLNFKQWDDEMKLGSSNPRLSRFAVKQKGWATLEATVVLLQLSEDTFVQHDNMIGVNSWQGGNISAQTAAAVRQFDLVIDTTLLTADLKQWRQKRLNEKQKADEFYQKSKAEMENARRQKKIDRKQQKKNIRQSKI